MSSLSPLIVDTGLNPLDLLEELVIQKDWPHDRINDEELIADMTLEWCSLRLWLYWHAPIGALSLTASFENRVPSTLHGKLYPLLCLVNEKLMMGHFDLGIEEPVVSFRHTLPLRGVNHYSSEQLDDLLQVCMHECERFYPALQSVLWGGKTAQEALQLAMFETAGEA